MDEILMIDDDPVYLLMATELLKQENVLVKTCNSVMDALGIEMDKLPSLIVLDYIMPEIDGLKFLEKVRGYDAFSDTYIIMSSGVMDEHTVLKAYELGADEFHCKIIGTRVLVHRICKILEIQKELKYSRDKQRDNRRSDRRRDRRTAKE